MSNDAEQQQDSVLESMDSLSTDLWFSVFKQLDWRSLVHASGVCRQWRSVATGCDSLWQRHFQERHSNTPRSRCSSNEMGGCAFSLGGLAAGPGQCQQALRAMEVFGVSQEATRQGAGQPPQQPCPMGGDSRDTPPAVAGQGVPADSQQDVCWQSLLKRTQALDGNWERGHMTRSCTLHGHADLIRCMQLSGDTLVSCSGSTSHADCSVRVWDVGTGACRRVLRGHLGPIWCMMYEPNLDRIATGSDDYTVRYWDASSGNSVVMEDPDSAVRCVHMDAAGRQLVAGTEFGRLLLWDMDQLEEVLSDAVQNVVEEYERLAEARATASAAATAGHPRPGTPSHGSRPGSSSGTNAARHGSPAGGSGSDASRMARAMSRRSLVQRAEVLLAGRHVVADNTNHVRLMDMAEEGKAISAIQVQSGLCATTSIEPLSFIQLWDVSRNSWLPVGTLGDMSMQFANSLSFDKQIGVLVAGCGDRNVRVWDLATGARRHLLSGHTGEIYSHQFDERRLASAALDGRICVWDMRSGKCQHVLQHNSPVHAFQFHGDRLVSGAWDGRVSLWDLRRGSLVQEWPSHAERVWAVALDDFHMASAGLDHTICLHSFVPCAEDPSQARQNSTTGIAQRAPSTPRNSANGPGQQGHPVATATAAEFSGPPTDRSNVSFTEDDDNAILKRGLQMACDYHQQWQHGVGMAAGATAGRAVQPAAGNAAELHAQAQEQMDGDQHVHGRRSPEAMVIPNSPLATAMHTAGPHLSSSPGSSSMVDISNSDVCRSMSRSASPGTSSEAGTDSDGAGRESQRIHHARSCSAGASHEALNGTSLCSQAISLSPSPSHHALSALGTGHNHSPGRSPGEGSRAPSRGMDSSMSCSSSMSLPAVGSMSRVGSDLMTDCQPAATPGKGSNKKQQHQRAPV